MNNHRSYTNGEITVFWKPELCWHAAECVTNLPSVFNISRRPWVEITAAPSDEIVRVVSLCPSGALSYEWNKK